MGVLDNKDQQATSSENGFEHQQIQKAEPIPSPLQESSKVARKSYQEYQRLCQLHGTEVEPWAAISLFTGSSVLKVSRKASEIALLPIVDFLCSTHGSDIMELDLTGFRLSPVSVRLLVTLLQENDEIISLNLSRTRLNGECLRALVDGLKKNTTLQYLNLGSNRIYKSGAFTLAHGLQNGIARNLVALHIANNTIGQAGGDILIRTCLQREITLHYGGNHVISEVFNCITHGFAFLLALIGSFIMNHESKVQNLDWKLRASTTMFCITLCFVYLSSTLYHSFFRTSVMKEVFRKLDHCSIFLLIAGSYSPFILKYVWAPHLPKSLFGPAVFTIIWSCALAGVAMSIGRKGKKASHKIRLGFALVMGWLAVFSIKLLITRMEKMALLLTLLGGLAYSLGIPLYMKGKEITLYHVYWHVAVMLGSAFHFAAIFIYVVGSPPISLPPLTN